MLAPFMGADSSLAEATTTATRRRIPIVGEPPLIGKLSTLGHEDGEEVEIPPQEEVEKECGDSVARVPSHHTEGKGLPSLGLEFWAMTRMEVGLLQEEDCLEEPREEEDSNNRKAEGRTKIEAVEADQTSGLGPNLK
ncbi:hypothetical protein DH2020_014338 [Rehmannia glutinosa]|uniref:Uncharacterized protein n=1 Tax=Rehmannia glutinosa TaxID=99300 RepID=A0ABR0WW28_REHGL